MPIETWNYAADGLGQAMAVLAVAALSAEGTSVRVAPFDDEVLAKLGVWLMGEGEDVAAVRERLDEALEKRKIRFHAIRWEGARQGR